MNNLVKNATPLIIPVILCGGAGTRLWPLSQNKKPKQLLPIVNETILLHDTLLRIKDCLDTPLSNIITVTTKGLSVETKQHLESFNKSCAKHILSEPIGKNTAAAIAYACLYAKETFSENVLLWILPSDHYVDDHDKLQSILEHSAKHIPDNGILTFGITPTTPETGYGYIETAHAINNTTDIQKVKSFTEKPDQNTAQKYIDTSKYSWNSGMFLATVKTFLNEYIEHCPQILSKLHNTEGLENIYNALPNISFDKAIMEKTNNAYVINCDIGWSDVGSWQSIWNIKSKDIKGNVLQGNIHTEDTQNCLIHSNNLTIAAIGLKDIAIIENEHGILVADKKNASSMRQLSLLSKSNSPVDLKISQKKWGVEKILSQSIGCTIKELTLQPEQETDYQYNINGNTHWTMASGSATTIINGVENSIDQQDSILISEKNPYQLKNTSDSIIKVIEIQYFDNKNNDNIIIVDQNSKQVAKAS